MKVFVLSLLCALVSNAAAGAVAWPGAAAVLSSSLFKTFIPPQTKAFSYSTTQYINSLPVSYPVGLQSQFAYQVPQLPGFSSIQQAYYPIAGSSYFPGNNVFYPSVAGIAPAMPSAPASPVSPAAPAQPAEGSQSFPTDQSAGDADTAVIESAEYQQQLGSQQQQQQTSAAEAPPQSQSSEPQFPPANTFPNFPPFPQFPQGSGDAPSFPSIPQFPQGSGEAPSFPSIPQFPQISVPGFPQFPQIPSGPNSPQAPSPSAPSTFPGNASGDKGLNDEDTISVESA